VIIQKRSPKTRLDILVTNENFDRLYRLAGELSLGAAINLLIEQAYTRFCQQQEAELKLRAAYARRSGDIERRISAF
jgi:hypothetical protein